MRFTVRVKSFYLFIFFKGELPELDDYFLILVLFQINSLTRHMPSAVFSPAISSAVDSRTGVKVAIKKLYRPFQSELFAKRAYRELRLLKHMKHENVRHRQARALMTSD